MSTFDKREELFEKSFVHEEELHFRAEARRNKLLGLWAAKKLGKTERRRKPTPMNWSPPRPRPKASEVGAGSRAQGFRRRRRRPIRAPDSPHHGRIPDHRQRRDQVGRVTPSPGRAGASLCLRSGVILGLMSELKASKLPAASAFLASAEVGEEAARWLGFLAGERRWSRHTIDAYGRDLRFFLGFLAEHQGALADFAALKALEPADLRAFLAKRRNEGLESRSLLRALAAVRSFLRFLEKKGLAKTDLFGAVRAPKRPRSLPKALAIADARDLIDQEFARGRGSRALGLGARRRRAGAALWRWAAHFGGVVDRARARARRRDRPRDNSGQRRQDPHRAGHRTGGGSSRAISIFAHSSFPADPCSSERAADRCRRASCNSRCNYARRARPARQRDAARAAPLLRHASFGAGRRSAHDSGIARPRLALDDADLHRRGQDPPVRSLSSGASARGLAGGRHAIIRLTAAIHALLARAEKCSPSSVISGLRTPPVETSGLRSSTAKPWSAQSAAIRRLAASICSL